MDCIKSSIKWVDAFKTSIWSLLLCFYPLTVFSFQQIQVVFLKCKSGSEAPYFPPILLRMNSKYLHAHPLAHPIPFSTSNLYTPAYIYQANYMLTWVTFPLLCHFMQISAWKVPSPRRAPWPPPSKTEAPVMSISDPPLHLPFLLIFSPLFLVFCLIVLLECYPHKGRDLSASLFCPQHQEKYLAHSFQKIFEKWMLETENCQKTANCINTENHGKIKLILSLFAINTHTHTTTK